MYSLYSGKDIGSHPENPTRHSAANVPSEEDILCNRNNDKVPDIYFNGGKPKRHLIHQKRNDTEELINNEPKQKVVIVSYCNALNFK